MGIAMHVVEHERAAMTGRKIANGSCDLIDKFQLQQALVRTNHRYLFRFGGVRSVPSTQQTYRRVFGNRQQPWSRAGTRCESFTPTPSALEGFLHNVFGIAWVSYDRSCPLEHERTVLRERLRKL